MSMICWTRCTCEANDATMMRLGRLFRDRSQRVLLSQHALSWATFLAGVVIGAHAFAYMGVPASLAVVALVLASLFAATLR